MHGQGCLRRLIELLTRGLSSRLDDAHHKKHDDATLPSDDKDSFAAAAQKARALPSLPVAQRLRLYGLYKQATVGDAPDAAASSYSSLLDPSAPLKLKAWTSLRGMPSAVARDQYVHAVRCAAGGEAVDDAADEATELDAIDAAMGSMAGPVMSSMSANAEEEEEMQRSDERLPLHAAARMGDASGCAKLLRSGHAVDGPDEDLHTPLHWACDSGHVEVARTLLASGAQVEARNCDGSTPLHMACACEHLHVAQLLIDAGASTAALDTDGCTPLDLAPSEMAEALGGASGGVSNGQIAMEDAS